MINLDLFLQTKYEKTYHDDKERSRREEIFRKTLDKINKHNLEFKNKKHSYKKSFYKFHDLTPCEISCQLFGLKLPA
jgi:hypothetical protein